MQTTAHSQTDAAGPKPEWFSRLDANVESAVSSRENTKSEESPLRQQSAAKWLKSPRDCLSRTTIRAALFQRKDPRLGEKPFGK